MTHDKKLNKPFKANENTSEFMKTLACGLAHELRTPLAIIGINTDLLSMSQGLVRLKGEEKEQAEKQILSIKHGIKLASYIVDNMLIMLRTLSTSQIKQELVRLFIIDDINEFLTSYPFLEHEKHLVKVDIDQVKGFFYEGDKVFTKYLLFNLVRNSLRAIKEAGRGEIKIVLGEDSHHNILVLTDTALGIPEEELLNKSDGTGLGLAFCNMVMRIYGGSISCRFKVGEYTEFKLKFPKVC